MLFPKAPASCDQKYLKLFLLHYFMSSSVSQSLKILLQTIDVNILVLRGVFFGIYVKLKALFLAKKKNLKKAAKIYFFCRNH